MRVLERLHVAEFQTTDTRRRLDAYAKAMDLEQYPDGSCGIGNVSIGLDNDSWSGKTSLELSGERLGEVKMVAEDIRRITKIRRRPAFYTGCILEV